MKSSTDLFIILKYIEITSSADDNTSYAVRNDIGGLCFSFLRGRNGDLFHCFKKNLWKSNGIEYHKIIAKCIVSFSDDRRQKYDKWRFLFIYYSFISIDK